MITILLLGLALTGSMTNLDMIETATIQAMEPLVEQISEYGIETITLHVQGDHEGGWLLEQIATSVLGGSDITVTTSREENGWELNLRPMELGVTYAQTGRSWVFGGKQVPRLATCQISASLVDASGIIVQTVREGAVVESIVSPSEIIILESSTEKWANGELSDQESGNVLEPLVVTGVVTALVYLFYSSRN